MNAWSTNTLLIIGFFVDIQCEIELICNNYFLRKLII